jgi:hypothetical protein
MRRVAHYKNTAENGPVSQKPIYFVEYSDKPEIS